MLKWQDLLRHSVKGNSIAASLLKKIPHMKSCPYWDRAQFLGRLSYRVKFANYNGGLVLYDNRIYYVSLSQIEALHRFVKWDLSKSVTVLEE
jgi:hypothetical protein